MGKILKREEAERIVGVFNVTGKDNFTWLIYIYNGNIQCPPKKIEFGNWLETYNLQYGENIQYIDRDIRSSIEIMVDYLDF